MRSFFVALLPLVVLGCGESARPLAEPVDFSGKVTDAAGKPVGYMELALQPMDNTSRPAYAPVGADGTFKGKAIPGKYAYFFQLKGGAEATQVPAKYRQGNKDASVQVSNGANLDLKLTP